MNLSLTSMDSTMSQKGPQAFSQHTHTRSTGPGWDRGSLRQSLAWPVLRRTRAPRQLRAGRGQPSVHLQASPHPRPLLSLGPDPLAHDEDQLGSLQSPSQTRRRIFKTHAQGPSPSSPLAGRRGHIHSAHIHW